MASKVAGKDASVKSWNELLVEVKSARAALDGSDQLWFRGQSDASHPLLPSLMRKANGPLKEQLLFQKFVQYSLRFVPRRQSDWETLFDMQHYGIPTRLVDWSENLGIAVFFAVHSWSKLNASNAAIYILNPNTINEYSGLARIPFVPDDPDFHYRSVYWEKKPFAPTYPIAIHPLFQNDRILAQKGMFTVHGDNTMAIERLCPKAVKRIVLSASAIATAQEFLEIANINARSVFPDVFGVAEYVKRLAGF